MKIDRKVVVVTGGASGLGAATARVLVKQKHAKVALFDLNEEAGNALVEELGNTVARFCKVDVTSEQSVANAVNQVVAHYGGIHVCINCAGVPSPCKVLDREGHATSLSKFANVVQVNLIGTFNVMSQCAQQMALNSLESNEERGVVINVSSGAAYEGQIGQCAYSASKSGVIGLNLPAARELGSVGIRVNAIAPGLFATPMVTSLGDRVIESLVAQVEAPKRMGRMEEFAHACVFLIENAYINGETIRLDAASRMQAK